MRANALGGPCWGPVGCAEAVYTKRIIDPGARDKGVRVSDGVDPASRYSHRKSNLRRWVR